MTAQPVDLAVLDIKMPLDGRHGAVGANCAARATSR